MENYSYIETNNTDKSNGPTGDTGPLVSNDIKNDVQIKNETSDKMNTGPTGMRDFKENENENKNEFESVNGLNGYEHFYFQ